MLRVYVFAKAGNVAQAGLTLTDFSVNVYRTHKTTQVSAQLVAAAALTRAIGGGFYVYTLDTDTTTYDLHAVVNYTGAIPLDITTWVGTDDSAIVQAGVTLLGTSLYADMGGVAQTGLTLADFSVNVWRVTKSDNQPLQIVSGAAMTLNSGGGTYRYYLASLDFTAYDYLVVITYTGAVALDVTLWTAHPLGDVEGAASCGPSYTRSLTRTLLPLDRWATLLGIDPRHFRQVTIPTIKAFRSCAKVWKQYAWQENGQIGRADIAEAIQQAEDTLAQYLGYRLAPSWESSEEHRAAGPDNAELWNIYGLDVRGYRHAVKAKWGHFVEPGLEAKTLIQANAGVSYSDADSDGYSETATVQVATTVTEPQEIAVYYPCESGDDQWEIRPLRSVVISGGVATIKLWRHQLVQPDLVEAIAPEAVDGMTAGNFLTTVDVYRHYTDPETQAELVWNPNTFACSCNGSGTTCCVVCGQTTQTGCLVSRNIRAGLLMYRPGEYAADGTWSTAELSCGRSPDLVRLNYRAGLRDLRRPWPNLQMDPQWERAVAYYSLALLQRDVCDCAPIKAIAEYWREDLANSGGSQGGGSFRNISDRELNNPLGTTRAAQFAWRLCNAPGQRVASAVRW